MIKPLFDLRTSWVDYGKFMAILLVAIGHQKLPWAVFQFIYSFHMPFFFMISGYLFSFHKRPTARSFIRHRAKTILIPYFSLGIITYAYWALISQRFGGHDNIPIWKPVVGMFYGVGEGGWLSHAVLAWFLPCLFMVEILYYFLFRSKSYMVLKLASLIGVALLTGVTHTLRLPFGLDVAFSGVLFYWVGHQGKTLLTRLVNIRLDLLSLVVLALASLTYTVAINNGKTDMRDLLYGDYYPLFLLGGVAGSVMLIGLSRITSVLFDRRYLIELIGRNTLITLFFQPIATSILKVLAIRLMHWPPAVFTAPHWLGIGFALAVIASQIPFILLINKYLPFTLGRIKLQMPTLVVVDGTHQKLPSSEAE